MEPLEREEQEIRAYVLAELPRRDKVTHAEKIATRRLYANSHDIWDVWTLKDRWWVITNPTDLYSQADFVSMEVAFTYHVGLGVVMAHRNAPPEEDDEALKITGPWRRWTEAADALNEAVEAADFQAVGVRCRETLLEFTRELASDALVPKGQLAPRAGDFLNWSVLIAGQAAPGPSLRRVREHLKTSAASAWELAGWLTHATHASRPDASITIEATSHTLSIFATAVLGAGRREQIACHVCGSYRVFAEYDHETRTYTGRIVWCDACGYGQPAKPTKPARSPSRPKIGPNAQQA